MCVCVCVCVCVGGGGDFTPCGRFSCSMFFPEMPMFSMSFVLDVNHSFSFGFRTKPLTNLLLLRLSANVMHKPLN